jgi:hypothetical protein
VDVAAVALLWMVGGLAAVLGALHWRSDAARSRRVLRRARVTPIEALTDGKLACIVGTVELEGEPIESLVTRRSCVAYDTTVQFFKGENAALPSHVEVERRMVPFFVADTTGRVRIDGGQAALCNAAIARSDRFEERIIPAGARIRLVGGVTLEPVMAPGEVGFREGGWKATITGSRRYPLLIDLVAWPRFGGQFGYAASRS